MDEKLAFFEKEWKKARADLAKCRQAQLRQEQELVEAHSARDRSERALQQLRKEHAELRSKLALLNDQLETNRQEQEELDKRVENLREQIRQPGFWLEQVETAFALDLEMLEALPELLPLNGSIDLSDWALELAERTEVLEATFDESLAEDIRKRLIAHWVYVRWLELTALVDDA